MPHFQQRRRPNHGSPNSDNETGPWWNAHKTSDRSYPICTICPWCRLRDEQYRYRSSLAIFEWVFRLKRFPQTFEETNMGERTHASLFTEVNTSSDKNSLVNPIVVTDHETSESNSWTHRSGSSQRSTSRIKSKAHSGTGFWMPACTTGFGRSRHRWGSPFDLAICSWGVKTKFRKRHKQYIL